MDPNQMPQAPFSPQPQPAPQPVPITPYQEPVEPQPAQVAMPHTAAIDEMTTPQANQNTYEASAAVSAAMTPQADAPSPAEPAQPEPAPAAPAPEAPAAPAVQPIVDSPIVAQPAAEPNKAKSGGKKKILVPILAIACIALVFGAGFLIYSLITNGGHKGEKALLAESIFVPKDEDEETYALFDKNGKQLTEFVITEHSSMVAEHSLVQNKDYKYGIIDQSGKMTVDWQEKTIK